MPAVATPSEILSDCTAALARVGAAGRPLESDKHALAARGRARARIFCGPRCALCPIAAVLARPHLVVREPYAERAYGEDLTLDSGVANLQLGPAVPRRAPLPAEEAAQPWRR